MPTTIDPLVLYAIPAHEALKDAMDRYDGLLNITEEWVLITKEKMADLVQQYKNEIGYTVERWEASSNTFDINLVIDDVLFTTFGSREELESIGLKV